MKAGRGSQTSKILFGAGHAAVGVPGAFSILAALAAGLALRIWMDFKFPQNSGDPLIYGDLAKNLLLHARFAITDPQGGLHATLIRLPGYPLFIAACFKLFGVENYFSIGAVQWAVDLATCLMLFDFVRRIAGARAAQCTLWLAVLCPFTAVYTAAALTETLTLFVIALALWALERFSRHPGWTSALLFTFAVSYAALLRPDGALLGVALAPAMVMRLREQRRKADAASRSLVRMAIVCLLLALAPFALWTVRNWRVFQVIQPLAPRYATDPGEDIHPGWQKWVKTWCLDFVSTYEIYWNVPGAPLELDKLPSRAFDSPAQRAETEAINRAYEDNGEDISPEIDAQFARLADRRIAAHPFRYYVWLPLGRLAETRFSWFYAALNAFYLVLGITGLCLRPRYWQWMLLYFILRSALLATIEAPEARYTLECFPMLFALGGIALYRLMNCVFLSVLNVKRSAGIERG